MRASSLRTPSIRTPLDSKPTPAETLEAINKTAADLSARPAASTTPAAVADAPAGGRASPLWRKSRWPKETKRSGCWLGRLVTTLRQVRALSDRRACNARHATAVAQKRLGLRRRRGQDRGRADGRRARQLRPARFVDLVRTVAPDAAGKLRSSSSKPQRRS